MRNIEHPMATSAARIWARQISRDGCKPLERSALTALRSDLDKWISVRCMGLIYGPLLTCQCTRVIEPALIEPAADQRALGVEASRVPGIESIPVAAVVEVQPLLAALREVHAEARALRQAAGTLRR